MAEGTTMIHDWVYENRAIYLTELTKIGAKVQLLDPHRVMIEGPTPKWRAAEVMCPPALRPGRGRPAGDARRAQAPRCCATSTSSTADYEDLAERLNALGATGDRVFRDIVCLIR
jgi:UDP-N-acetylglucosamine 1-carboxyvinyltransferase